MRQLTWWSLGIAVLALMGCASNGDAPIAPSTTTAADALAGLGATTVRGDVAESALALYAVRIDPATLSATTELLAQRAATATDDLYELPIGGFLRRDSLRITGITGDAEELRLDYTFEHPFAAPTDLDAPATAKNRIDLGITGRLLFLVDSQDPTADTYFDETGSGNGRVIAATDAIANPDGYYTPGAMVTNSLAANTFPYKVLVDETEDSRTSTATGAPISNGGSTLGNFDPIQGWTRATLGATNDGWTGLGFLHQGQTVTSTVEITKDYLSAHDFSFEVAILAKYNDPRGGATGPEKRANRLPAQTPDLAQFGYRGLHAALDVESIRFAGESTGFMPNTISASELRFHVVDWDSRAQETDQTDLAADTSNASLVAGGESGVPTLQVSLPGIFGSASTIVTLSPGALLDDDSAAGGDSDVDSGHAGDPLYFAELVTKGAGSGQVNSTQRGMVRATDVEDALDGFVLALDGNLQPLTTDIPRPIAYQAFDVQLSDGNDVPTLTLTTPANVLSGTPTSVTVTAANDPNGDPITLQLDWDNDGVYEDTQLITAPYITPVTFNSTVPKYNNTTLLTLNRTIPVRYTDGVIASPIVYTPALTFSLGPNRAPEISGAPVLLDATLISPATFTLNAGTATFSDPEGDAVTLKVVNNVNSNLVTGAAFPIGGLGPYTNPGTPSVAFTVWATDLLHPGTGAGPVDGSAFAAQVGTVQVPCTPTINQHTWAFTSGSDGWTSGHLFTPQVFNSDNAPGNSRFYRCNVKSSQGAGFSGGCITTGPHAVGGCGNNDNDYGAQCDNSMIGPTFSLAGKTDAVLRFNSSKNGRNGATIRYRIWVSTDNGANWLNSNIIWDTEKTGSGMVNENNLSVSLQAYAGMSNLRLRFQFLDPTNSSYSVSSTQFAGWSVDNIRVDVCP